MIERPPRPLEPEIIASANCFRACPGCPAHRKTESPVMRVIGNTPLPLEPHRFVEWASGDLPLNPKDYPTGTRRAIIAFFGEEDAAPRIEAARTAGVSVALAARRAGQDEMRELIRLSWKLRAPIGWSDIDALCIGARFD